jgi:hypothetical protein
MTGESERMPQLAKPSRDAAGSLAARYRVDNRTAGKATRTGFGQ